LLFPGRRCGRVSWVLIFGKVPQETAGWIQSVAKGSGQLHAYLQRDPAADRQVSTAFRLIMTVPILLPGFAPTFITSIRATSAWSW